MLVVGCMPEYIGWGTRLVEVTLQLYMFDALVVLRPLVLRNQNPRTSAGREGRRRG